MAYSPTTFVSGQAPGIDATELNKLGNGIKVAAATADSNDNRLDILEPKVTKNTADIAAFSSGEVLKGAFTPTGGAEYPASGTNWSYYISNVAENGYTYTGGTLVGKTAQNMDKIIYTSAGWSLIQNNLTVSIPNGAIGNINNPLLDLPLNNSLALKQGVGSVTFTRASTATYVDRYGVLKTAAVDEARFEKEGLLIEGASTNITFPSSTFGSSYVYNATSTTVSGVNPFGDTTNLRELNASVVDGFSDEYSPNATSLNIGDTITASYFVKVGTATRIVVSMIRGSAFASTDFDLSSGTIVSTTVGTGKITKLGNGYFRVSISGVVPDNASGFNHRIQSKNVGTTYWYGRQIEKLTFATSYIPTTTAAATRAKDECNATYLHNTPALSLEDFTVLADFDTLGLRTYQFIIDVQDYFYYYLTVNASNKSRFTYGTINSGDLIDAFVANQKYRLAGTRTNSKIINYIDGVAKASYNGTSTYEPSQPSSNINLGGNGLFGHISDVRIYDKALTAEEIALA